MFAIACCVLCCVSTGVAKMSAFLPIPCLLSPVCRPARLQLPNASTPSLPIINSKRDSSSPVITPHSTLISHHDSKCRLLLPYSFVLTTLFEE